MTTTLLAPPALWDEIRNDLLSSPDLERAAVGFAGIHQAGETTRLLLREWWPVNQDEYLVQLGYHLEISPAVWARSAKRARESGEAIVIMHSHPKGRPFFSESDDWGEDTLVPKLHARACVPVGSVVFSPLGELGRVSHPGNSRSALTLRRIGSSRRPALGSSHADFFDRQVRALTTEGQATIAAMRVGVVGAGGLGSHVIQQLAHLGIGEVVVVDFDRVTTSNLSRLVGAHRSDALRQVRKTAISSRLARDLRSGTMLTALDGNIVDGEIAPQLLDCDVIVGCTDNQWSRVVLNTLAYQYYVPVLDLGVELQPHGALGGRVTWLLPGSACLWCLGILDPNRVRIEQLPPDVVRDEEARGYISGIQEHAPAVVSINGVIASLGVTELLARFTGFAGGQVRPNVQVYRIDEGVVRRISAVPKQDCPTCSVSGQLGGGELVVPPWRSNDESAQRGSSPAPRGRRII